MKYISSHEQWLWSFELANSILKSGWKPDAIIGLYKGGIFPAIVIEDYFMSIGMKAMHFPLCCRSYDEAKAKSASDDVIVYDMPSYAAEKASSWKTVLVVDDICDTGKTLAAVENMLLKNVSSALDIQSACLIWKTDVIGQAAKPTWCAKQMQSDEWIVFPHEFCKVDLESKLKHEGINNA